MLCCVSKRAVAADQGPPYDQCPVEEVIGEPEKIELETYVEDAPPILLPCAICARTFMPQSLEKHSKICERSLTKKRKPFDSAKQRIQGTELAEFLPKQERKRSYQDDHRVVSKPKTSWKENHDDFLRAIRAARSEIVECATQRQCSAVVSSGAPTRSNEQGMCPTCNRHFGIKAYDRHVAWCKERATRVPASPATNIAKERLEARMKYRAPSLKSRRATTREKYSPGSAIALHAGSKNSGILQTNKPKESLSTPSCNKGADSPIKPKPALVRRSGQTKETNSNSAGPMKSRPIDRIDGQFHLPLRPIWSNYVRRRPDFNLVLTGRTGTCKEYNPFLLAEQQMNELLSDTSDQSVDGTSRDSLSNPQNNDSLFPLSHSSAFVKYPYQTSSNPNKRSSLIAPPSEFDDLTSDFSSDSTETNSLSREVFLKDLKESKELKDSLSRSPEKKSPTRELGRRVIIDKSKALGGEVPENVTSVNKNFIGNNERARKLVGKSSPKVLRPNVNRSHSVRAASAPKPAPERKNSNNLSSFKKSPQNKNYETEKASSATSMNSRNNNNYMTLSGSNLSLSSIMSSEIDIKRSNSVFDELMTSFEDDNGSFPSMRSLLKTDSLSMSSPVHGTRHRNGQISDEELSSPESYKRQDHSKFSADSAYSSLNRKYSHHGRNTNDMTGRLEEDHRQDCEGGISSMSKLPKYCHNCGTKFPRDAKFCCGCGLRRLAL